MQIEQSASYPTFRFMDKYLVPLMVVLLATLLIALAGCTAQDAVDGDTKLSGLEDVVVEASCGQCKLEMEGDGCDLAIRHEGKTYFVDGVGIDDLGDAHAADGFCNAIRKAKVTGKIVEGRFVADDFKLVDGEEE